jgi:hypothetical protein
VLNQFLFLGGAGIIVGVLALGVGRRRRPVLIALAAVGTLALSAVALHAVVSLRGCPVLRCGENAHELTLIAAGTNAVTLWITLLVGVALGYARLRA